MDIYYFIDNVRYDIFTFDNSNSKTYYKKL